MRSPAVALLRGAGVDGPYGVALGPRCYEAVIETTQKGGYPVLEQLRLITGGPIVGAGRRRFGGHESRGGDFELTLGEDFAIGFVSADAELVQLYLEESLAFRALTRGRGRTRAPDMISGTRPRQGGVPLRGQGRPPA